ncbi:hypothetical protein ATANTOWER_021075, partial [Ataeniobius toweri]|nr:hypothetical protein [Ataeniobius toweri]
MAIQHLMFIALSTPVVGDEVSNTWWIGRGTALKSVPGSHATSSLTHHSSPTMRLPFRLPLDGHQEAYVTGCD